MTTTQQASNGRYQQLESQFSYHPNYWTTTKAHPHPHPHHYPSPPISTSTSNLTLEAESSTDRPWSYSNSHHIKQFSLSSNSEFRPMNMSIPPISLDSSWRTESPPNRRSGAGKEREVIWDVDNLPNGLDALGLISPPAKKDEIQKHKEKEDRDGPSGVKVLARIMDTSKGRDKVLKCIQYSLRTYLYLLSLISRIRPLSPWFKSNSKRMKIAISGLSMTRKCLLLLNPLHPLSDLLSHEPMSPRTLVGHLIDLFSALSDDIYCLAKLGLVGKRTGKIADVWANRFWLLTTLMGLYKLHIKTIPKIANSSASLDKRRNELKETNWTNRKLLADLAFVSYDVFELNFPLIEEPMKCFTGLLSGLISTFKLYDQHWEASVGKG